MTYTHLTMKELTWIDHYYEISTPVRIIAQKLGRSLQTIYNVVNYIKQGNTVQEYYDTYLENKKKCGRKSKKLSDSDISYIKEHESKGWTPDILCNHPSSPLKISTKTLYRRYKDDERLSQYNLPMKGKRKPNGYTEKRGGSQSFCLTIEDRERIFPNYESEYGHIEGDSIIGKAHKSRAITLAGRKFKTMTTLKPLSNCSIGVTKRLDEWLSNIPRYLIKSITFDRGKEFSGWRELCNKHDIYIFFADPGRPSQRAINENGNGLLRRDGLPKQTDFNDLSEEQIQSVAKFRNRIPRKSLGYKSPIEALSEWLGNSMSAILA